jgi:DNA-directed RNA polymerase subunit M/transcription elongation factor TFIIS
MWKKQSQMSFQIEVKPQRISSSNYNCPKCGYKYKSLRSYPSNLDAKIIQIIECLNCNYSWRESWELPMWRSYRRA